MTYGGDVSYGSGRILSGQADVIGIPDGGARGRRAVILGHGQLQTTSNWVTPSSPGQFSILPTLVAAGFVVIGCDLDGPAWGNATAVADIDTCRLFAGTLGCATDKILGLGASMGAYDLLAYMAAHPASVAALYGMIPANDLNDLRDNDRASAQSYINTAWGLPAGSTSATAPLPAGANVSDPSVAAVIATSGPILLAYSTVDTTVPPATVTTFAARVGVSCATVVADTTSGHTDTTMGEAAALPGTPTTANLMCQFLNAYAVA